MRCSRHNTGRYLETTDDAYVRADWVALSARVGGYVAQVEVQDDQTVKAGDVLVRLQDRDYRAHRERAEARVARPLRPFKPYSKWRLSASTSRHVAFYPAAAFSEAEHGAAY